MKVKYLKLKSWLAASLMGALGFSACQSNKQLASPKEGEKPVVREREEIRLMYGVPTMNYMIRGQVKDEAGKPVKGVLVNKLEQGLEATPDTVYGDPTNVKQYLEETAVKTDRKGRFEIKDSGLPQKQFRLLVRDVDGKANGEYKNKLIDVEVSASKVDRTNASGWNQGTFEDEVDIRLEQK